MQASSLFVALSARAAKSQQKQAKEKKWKRNNNQKTGEKQSFPPCSLDPQVVVKRASVRGSVLRREAPLCVCAKEEGRACARTFVCVCARAQNESKLRQYFEIAGGAGTTTGSAKQTERG